MYRRDLCLDSPADSHPEPRSGANVRIRTRRGRRRPGRDGRDGWSRFRGHRNSRRGSIRGVRTVCVSWWSPVSPVPRRRGIVRDLGGRRGGHYGNLILYCRHGCTGTCRTVGRWRRRSKTRCEGGTCYGVGRNRGESKGYTVHERTGVDRRRFRRRRRRRSCRIEFTTEKSPRRNWGWSLFGVREVETNVIFDSIVW